MAGLSWARVDASIIHHDKFNTLLDIEGGSDAFVLYMFALVWSVNTGTNGHIRRADLRGVRGDPGLAKLLVDCGLWDSLTDGLWVIHNFEERQATPDTARILSEAGRRGGLTTQQRKRDAANNPQA